MPDTEKHTDALAQRLKWPLQVGRLDEMEGDEPDLSATTTLEERWSMMWQITQDLWAFRGEPIAEPELSRHVGVVIRRGS